ncbi:hypothetical protein [Achromobacter sp. Root565]|uniref:hypothetical protein n=1 Tax=Achromobacter sp. Root565 TaxID=1736564 RepID=UPI0006F3D583|nr:hypothetical protein [Achromobacter sp. Root565]KQZ96159.1 hypothetical protein ASD71_26215 [Achromobacter sp. Root565]
MDLPEWYENKSAAYVEEVEKFVAKFWEDADLEKDLVADPDDPDDDPKERDTKRQAAADSIRSAFPADAFSFQDDALAELITQRAIADEDDEAQHGHLRR